MKLSRGFVDSSSVYDSLWSTIAKALPCLHAPRDRLQTIGCFETFRFQTMFNLHVIKPLERRF